ncbi:MAG: peptidase A24, partial [Methanomicrobiales archaeon]|nr:peptidase A24 [Methanomicrobiales archaeon]
FILFDTLWLNRISTKENHRVTAALLVVPLVLLGVSWSGAIAINPFLLVLFCGIAAILGYATWLDLQERATPVRIWYLVLVLLAYGMGEYGALRTDGSGSGIYLILTAAFCLIIQVFLNLHLMGGADGYALIFIGLTVPAFPLIPLTGVPSTVYFPLSVLVNALLLNIVTPLGIFAWNLLKGNRAPFGHMFLGFPVPGERIGESFGFLMEEIEDHDGQLVRRFIPVRRLIRLMFGGKRTLSTQKMKMHPDQYARELALCRRAGQVWIQYGIPFIIPITAGFLSALIFGDILYAILRITGGI